MAVSQLGPKGVYRTQLTYNSLMTTGEVGVALRDDEDELGMIRLEYDSTNGIRAYRFVNLDSGSGSLVAGDLAVMKDKFGQVATSVFSSSVANKNSISGVAIGALTAGNHGWLQIGGDMAAVNTTGSTFAVGDQLIHSGTDKVAGKVTLNTAPTNQLLAIATAATSGNFTEARLCLPFY